MVCLAPRCICPPLVRRVVRRLARMKRPWVLRLTILIRRRLRPNKMAVICMIILVSPCPWYRRCRRPVEAPDWRLVRLEPLWARVVGLVIVRAVPALSPGNPCRRVFRSSRWCLPLCLCPVPRCCLLAVLMVRALTTSRVLYSMRLLLSLLRCKRLRLMVP